MVVDESSVGYAFVAYTMSPSYAGAMRVVVAAVVACLFGMALFVAGLYVESEAARDWGAWLTIPLTLLYAVPILIGLLSGPLAACLHAVERWRRRTQR